jgi:hypothetical protein
MAFCGIGSRREETAAMYSLIITATMNDVDSRTWLAYVTGRIADNPVRRLDELLPWNWWDQQTETAAAA